MSGSGVWMGVIRTLALAISLVICSFFALAPAHAQVDVDISVDVEPPPQSHPLFGLDNVILTPHIGWASTEAGWEIRRSILDDILAFARGGTARCVINGDVLFSSRS